MLIALVAALIAVLSGGQTSPFVLTKVQKYVKQEVDDKERRAEMTAILKDYEKEWKKLQKASKKQRKEVAKLNKDFGTDESSISKIMTAATEDRMALKEKLVVSRLAAQEVLTEEEWAAIVDKGLDTKPKKDKKLTKADAKAKIEQDKQLVAIGDEIEAAFTDPDKRAQATQYLLKFEDDLTSLLVASQEYPERAKDLIRNSNATREQIEELVVADEEFRSVVHKSFLELRKNLRTLTTEDNWPKLAKALGKFI